jgi:hypothetical protein
MAELYAAKAEIKDDRVKELAFTDATFTEKAYTESALTVSRDAGVKVASKNYTLEQSKAQGYVTEQEVMDSTTNLKEFDKVAYENEKAEADVIFNDAARPIDEQAAGEIIKEISDEKIVQKEKEEARSKFYFSNSRDHFISAFRIALLKEDTTVDKFAQKELDRKISRQKTTIEEVLTKYSKVASYADSLLEASATAAKAMTAPVQKTDKKYEDL